MLTRSVAFSSIIPVRYDPDTRRYWGVGSRLVDLHGTYPLTVVRPDDVTFELVRGTKPTPVTRGVKRNPATVRDAWLSYKDVRIGRAAILTYDPVKGEPTEESHPDRVIYGLTGPEYEGRLDHWFTEGPRRGKGSLD